jgi:hypothetical protein
VDPCERPDVSSLSFFEKLWAQGKKLDYEPTDELFCFESFLSESNELLQRMKSVFSAL